MSNPFERPGETEVIGWRSTSSCSCSSMTTTAKDIRHFIGSSVVCREAYDNERQVDGILSLRGKKHVQPVRSPLLSTATACLPHSIAHRLHHPTSK